MEKSFAYMDTAFVIKTDRQGKYLSEGASDHKSNVHFLSPRFDNQEAAYQYAVRVISGVKLT